MGSSILLCENVTVYQFNDGQLPVQRRRTAALSSTVCLLQVQTLQARPSALHEECYASRAYLVLAKVQTLQLWPLTKAQCSNGCIVKAAVDQINKGQLWPLSFHQIRHSHSMQAAARQVNMCQAVPSALSQVNHVLCFQVTTAVRVDHRGSSSLAITLKLLKPA